MRAQRRAQSADWRPRNVNLILYDGTAIEKVPAELARLATLAVSHYLRHVATPFEPLAQCWQVGGGEQVICD